MDVEVPGGERLNVQTGEGDRVSTISLLGCSTSVALATGPTDREEEEAATFPRTVVNSTDFQCAFSSIFQRAWNFNPRVYGAVTGRFGDFCFLYSMLPFY